MKKELYSNGSNRHTTSAGLRRLFTVLGATILLSVVNISKTEIPYAQAESESDLEIRAESLRAKKADTTNRAQDEDLSIDFLKDQLARSRAAAANTPAAIPSVKEEGAAVTGSATTAKNSASDLDKESARLIAEESALLNQLSDTKAPVKGSPQKAAAASDTASRASLDINKAEQEKRAAKAELEKLSGDGAIEVIREAPSTTAIIPTNTNTVTSIEASEVAEQAVNRQNSDQSEAMNDLKKSNAELKRQLDSALRRLKDNNRNLEEARNRLLLAETEVERLSSVMDQRNKATLGRGTTTASVPAPGTREYRAPQKLATNGSAAIDVARANAVISQTRAIEAAKIKPDMLIATVTAPKAQLRTGPGKNNSPLMAVSQGTRLAIETRNGDWYRVVTPTGSRAWVSAEVLAFGADGLASPTRTVRVGGVSAPQQLEQ